ncbi:hypothetical protein CC86DRAFT_388800 [Ophiobolus disseminans]|uniref:Uncharacterized protein n=1 Tax=Ophiobolus disseminans TaxID=1469910 RepID=A0A6A6ZC64_9PLEO|nr:hypothetical protein CC86DRAFT_388800 [Ophiobolus disseminans]
MDREVIGKASSNRPFKHLQRLQLGSGGHELHVFGANVMGSLRELIIKSASLMHLEAPGSSSLGSTSSITKLLMDEVTFDPGIPTSTISHGRMRNLEVLVVWGLVERPLTKRPKFHGWHYDMLVQPIRQGGWYDQEPAPIVDLVNRIPPGLASLQLYNMDCFHLSGHHEISVEALRTIPAWDFPPKTVILNFSKIGLWLQAVRRNRVVDVTGPYLDYLQSLALTAQALDVRCSANYTCSEFGVKQTPLVNADFKVWLISV